MEELKSIQWFPGHMTRTKRRIEAQLKLIDAVAVLLDARVPYSSCNPDLRSIINNKPRLVILNKCDMADPAETKKWLELFREKGTAAYTMEQIPAKVKHSRARELIETQSRVIDKINKRLLNTTLEAIADGTDFGRTYKDAPDIDGKVTFTHPVTVGSVFKARVVAAEGYERELIPL